MGFGVWGLGFGVWDFIFRVSGFGFRVSGFGIRVSGSGRRPGFRGGLSFKVHRLVYHSTLGWRVIKKKKKKETWACSSLRSLDHASRDTFRFGVWSLGFGVRGLGFGVWGSGFGVWGLGFGVWGLGFEVWVFGSVTLDSLFVEIGAGASD